MRIVGVIAWLLLSINTVGLAQHREVKKEVWRNDPAHSQLSFSVMHMGISKTYGQFDKFNVNVETNGADLSTLKVTLEAEVKSINTSVEMRDNHLRSADFFEVEEFPTLLFESTLFTPDEKDKKRGKLYGELTIKGIKKAVELDVIYFGAYDDEKTGSRVAGFQITGQLNRKDFGVGSSFLAGVIADEVSINANMEFITKR